MRTLAALLLSLFVLSAQAQVLGKKPEYLKEHAASFSNDAAVAPRTWIPGLEEGYTPQGLAVVGKHAFVSAYRDDLKGQAGSCRVFRVDLTTGNVAGHFDLPADCNHAGGLAHIGGGKLVIADTRALWRVDIAKALAAGKATDALEGTLKLAGVLFGSFSTFDGTDLWIGRYTVQKEADLARLHRIPLRLFAEKDGRTIDESDVSLTLPSPPLGQGMAITKDAIWIGASSSKIGWLVRLERETGKVMARYDTIIGLEGIAFDEQGVLWGLSEAGAKKYQHWDTHYPLIFTIDPAKLK